MTGNTDSSEVGLPTANSGFTTASVIAVVAGGVFVAWCLAWVYSPAEYHIPLIYINLVVTYGMGWAMGCVTRGMLRRKRINRAAPAMAAALIVGLFGLWFSWLTYIWVVLDYDFAEYIDFALHPQYVANAVQVLARNPVWTMGRGGSSDPAVLYYFVWLVEAAMLVGIPVHICRRFVRDNLLCDDCKEWLRETGDSALFSFGEADRRQALVALEAGDLTPLDALPRLAEGDEASDWLLVQGFACANCRHRDGYVSVTMVTIKINKKKEPEQVRKPLAKFIPVDVETEKRIFEPAEKMREDAEKQAETARETDGPA